MMKIGDIVSFPAPQRTRLQRIADWLMLRDPPERCQAVIVAIASGDASIFQVEVK